jgi:hypothetical protein
MISFPTPSEEAEKEPFWCLGFAITDMLDEDSAPASSPACKCSHYLILTWENFTLRRFAELLAQE